MSTDPRSQYYNEGYADGQQYQSQYPGLGQREFAQAQQGITEINEGWFGWSEAQNEQYQGGFVDGYHGYEYGDSLYVYPSIGQFEGDWP